MVAKESAMGTHPPGKIYERVRRGYRGHERPCWPVMDSVLCVIANPETLATSGWQSTAGKGRGREGDLGDQQSHFLTTGDQGAV